MKSIVLFCLASVLVSVVFFSPVSAQKKKKTSVGGLNTESLPNQPTMVDIDTPPPPPPFAFNVGELKFGAQGTSVQSCLYVTITNLSPIPQEMTKLFTYDEKNYSIPSPSTAMLPIKVQPQSNLTISVCFKPDKVGEFKTKLVIRTPNDSVVIPVSGKGIKAEDVGKLPKNELVIVKPKKKNTDWKFKLQLISSSKVTLQIFDELGSPKITLLNGDFKNDGTYEIAFDGLDKGKIKLPAGKYFVRCVIEDVTRGNLVTKFTKPIELKS